MNKPSLAVVLAEDQRHRRFVRAYLKGLGFHSGTIRLEPMSGSRGCGEQWVRQRYASVVHEYRVRHAKTVVIVAIDANGGDVDRRRRQLSESLMSAGEQPRADSEGIVHLIPKRNIETWILCLNGEQVDEDEDYKARVDDQQIAPAARAFLEGTRRGVQPPCHWIPSLLAVIPEVRRLDR